MKFTRFLLKIIALCLAIAAAACAIIAYWDNIADFFGCVRDRFEEKGCRRHPSEYDDYADWDE